ncbi:MAG: M1 family aminopeptidase, partial [bacterium]
MLYRSRARDQWSKTVLRRSARALEWLSEKFGRYPYPQLSVVQGLLAGGMEYPMLVMNSSERESLILHEVGHIYFYGILANNEWQEAWLDEGFTSFQRRWYMESRYGKWGFDREAMLKSGTLLQRVRPAMTSREQNIEAVLAYMNSGHNEPISKPAYAYEGPVGYSRNAYTKGAFFYDMLKYVVGDENFDKICKAYFQRWKFKHVNKARFQEVCEEISGLDLNWFFDQWLDQAVTIDYGLARVEKDRADSLWQTQVYVVKMEQGTMPVEVQLTTLTGDTLVQRWDGLEKVGRVDFQTAGEPDQVILDPRDAILDNSRFNNQPLKARVMFDYPNMTYRPRDALLFTWRPSGWYNNVDKLRIGGRLRGWQARQKSAEFGVWYGVHSNILDARVNYSNQIKALGPGSQGSLLIEKMEGRMEFDASLSFVKSRNLSSSPKHKIRFGLNHSKLLNGDARLYTLREFNNTLIPTWSKGTVNKAYARYSVNPRGLTWFANLGLGVESVQEDWGSDFTFNAISGELKFWSVLGTNGFH